MRTPRLRIFAHAAAVVVAAGAMSLVAWSRLRSEPLAPLQADSSAWTIHDELVLELRTPQSAPALTSFASRFGLSLVPSDPSDRSSALSIVTLRAPDRIAASLLPALRAEPSVLHAEPQRVYRALWTPNDPRFADQWNLKRIGAEKAWNRARGKGAVVAVIDTGVALGYDGTESPCKDFTGVKQIAPRNVIDPKVPPLDDNGHGTHVSGTIAEATNNHEGAAGLAFESTIMPIKVLSSSGSGRMSDIAKAIRWAADHGANVINMSLGAPFPDSITREACRYAAEKGVLIVCAAGNSGGRGVSYPAAYPECMAVSAVGPTGKLAPYSSWGRQVAIAAPGGDKQVSEGSGILQNTLMPDPSGDDTAPLVDGYYYLQGTSMASPHVAAAAALVVSQGVRDPGRVRDILTSTANRKDDVSRYGAGELNAAAAVAAARRTALGGSAVTWIAVVCAGLFVLLRGRGAWAWTAIGLAGGLGIPEIVIGLVGSGSLWTLVAHSAIVPAYLLAAEADTAAERCAYGAMLVGVSAHIAAGALLGGGMWAAPDRWVSLAWAGANLGIAGLVLLSEVRKRRG